MRQFLVIKLKIALFLSAIILTSDAWADDGSGMKTSASVDATGSFKLNKASQASDRFDLREAELMVYGPVDYLFDGMLSLAAHREDGVSLFEIHEAYLASSKWIPRTTLKVGQYFLGLGRLNQVHRHEWPFISAPKIHAKLFGEEDVLDSGAEISYLFPLPFFLDLTFGLSNGWTYGHAHSEGEKPVKPTHYLRVGSYLSLPGGGGAKTGLNYLNRKDAFNEETWLYGFDWVAKWRKGQTLLYLLQAEIWQRTLKPKSGNNEKVIGAYLLSQMAISSTLSFGLRLDSYSILSLKDASGQSLANREMSYVPTLSYKPSEFSSLRLAYCITEKTQAGLASTSMQSLEFQTTFTLGAHPAHDF